MDNIYADGSLMIICRYDKYIDMTRIHDIDMIWIYDSVCGDIGSVEIHDICGKCLIDKSNVLYMSMET